MPPKNVKEGMNLLENAGVIDELRKKQSPLGEIIREARHVLLFFIFIGIFTGLVLTEELADFNLFEESMRDLFENPPPTAGTVPGPYSYRTWPRIKLDEVQSVDNFYTYLNTTFLEACYRGGADDPRDNINVGPNEVMSNFLNLDGMNYNIVVGKIMIRSKRVKPITGCTVPAQYSTVIDQCFSGYSLDNEDTAEFGRFPPLYAFTNDDSSATIQGTLAEYEPGGYDILLDQNGTRTLELFGSGVDGVEDQTQPLKYNQYVDLNTRAIVIEFNVYNTNEQFLSPVQLLFEISPAGSWTSKMNFFPITERYLKPVFNSRMIVEMALVLFVAYYIAQELSEFTISVGAYMSDGWNIVDWANLLLLIWVKFLEVGNYVGASSGIFAELADPAQFTPITDLAATTRQIRALNAFNAVLIWVKTVKYVGFIPYVQTMLNAVKYSWRYFVSFFVFFATMFFGFVVAYQGGFGDKINALNTVGKSALFLSQSFLGSTNFEQIYNNAGWMGGVIIGLFLFGIYFIMLNLLFAIFVVAMSEAKARETSGSNKEWIEFKQKAHDFIAHMWEQLDIENYIKTYLPGYHKRREIARDEEADLMERRRIQHERAELRFQVTQGKGMTDDEDDGGPDSPNCGVQKILRKHAGAEEKGFGIKGNAEALPLTMGEDGPDGLEQESSDESEIDLGILSNSKVKVRKKRMKNATESEVLLTSVQHIGSILANRSDTVRTLVLGEMQEVKMICHVIADVLEVLGRRGNDLAKQQTNFIDSLGF